MASSNSQLETARENEVRIASFLLHKNLRHFDDELYFLCTNYAKQHKELKAALDQLDKARLMASQAGLPSHSTLRERICDVFDRPFSSMIGKVVFAMTSLFIFLSVISLICESLPKWNPTVVPRYKETWLWIEGGVTIYFTVEMLFRLAVAADKISFFKKITNVTDFIALVPFYVEILADTDLGALRVLRLLRLLQFFRNFNSVNDLFVAVWQSLKVLGAPILFLATCLLIMSTLVYYAERGTYSQESKLFTMPDCNCEASAGYQYGDRPCARKESQFFSILHTLWWGVVTLTTVGYGDLVPQCSFGKVVAGVSMVLGVVFMAMPIAIVGSYFTLSVDKRKQREFAAKIEEAKRKKVWKEQVRKEHDENLQATVRKSITPAIAFLRFMRDRVEDSFLPLDDPSPYMIMLIDFYFGTQRFSVDAAPSAVTYEMQYIPLEVTGAATVTCLHKHITLNRYTDLVIGSSSMDFPDPDIVLPLDKLKETTGVEYRISQRHAVVSIPPQFTDISMLIRPLRGVSIYVNGTLVPQDGVSIRANDVINLHTPQLPLLYKVKAIHPFTLDI